MEGRYLGLRLLALRLQGVEEEEGERRWRIATQAISARSLGLSLPRRCRSSCGHGWTPAGPLTQAAIGENALKKRSSAMATAQEPSPLDPAAPADHPHNFDVQKELHRKIRNDPDYDDWDYGTEPLPHEAWVPPSSESSLPGA
jgi:hypothetical protein